MITPALLFGSPRLLANRNSCRRRSLFLLALFFVVMLAQNSAFAACQANVGAVPMLIPAPAEGFVEAGPENAKTMDIMVVQQNRLLCAFLTPDDYSRMLSPQRSQIMDRYMMVEVQKASEDKEYSDADFKELGNVLRTQFGDLVNKTTQPTQDQLNERLKKLNSPEIKMDKPVPLGSMYSGPNAEAYGLVMDYSSADGSSRRMAMSAVFVKVKSRLIFVYIYSVYKDPATVDWLKQMSEQWSKSILAANQS